MEAKGDMKHQAPESVVHDGRQLPPRINRATARPSRTVRLEPKTETNPSAISSTPSQVAVQPRPSSATSAMGKATGAAGGTEAATASLAAGAAARSASTSI